jgi:uncharacterized protein CbrC (UPF0167 family)
MAPEGLDISELGPDLESLKKQLQKIIQSKKHSRDYFEQLMTNSVSALYHFKCLDCQIKFLESEDW